MKKKRQNTAFSIVLAVVLFLTFGCGKKVTRETLAPKYIFEIDETVDYALNMKVDISADAGFFRYNGSVDFSVDMEIKAVAFDTNLGYRMQMVLRDPQINGGDQRINAIVIIGLNLIRTWMSTFYMSPEGRITIFYQDAPHAGLTSYGQAIFPDFSDMDKLRRGYTTTTNFAAKMQEKRYTMVFGMDIGINQDNYPLLDVGNNINISLYDEQEYIFSVEPLKVGNVDINLIDTFDYDQGKLLQKTGDISMSFDLSMSQGFLSFVITIEGNGSIDMVLVPKEPQA